MKHSQAEYGSDLVVQLLERYGIEVVAFNPGATFRGIHDSLVHRGSIRVVLCTHEEIALAVAHGYAKAAGRPMAVLLHDVVGLQHATMAIYNAWVDRAPVLMIGGTGPKPTGMRRPWVDWVHTASVQAEQIRQYIKWDDEPADASSIPDAITRAVQIAQTVPAGPVYVNLDTTLQEQPLDGLIVPAALDLRIPAAPGPVQGEVQRLAAEIRGADLPAIVTDYAAAERGAFDALIALATATGCAVFDGGRRFNFPTWQPQNISWNPELLEEADLVVAIEVEDLWGRLRGTVFRESEGGLTRRSGVRVVHATTGHFGIRSWSHAYQRLAPIDRLISSAALPLLDALVDEFAGKPVPDERVARRKARLEAATATSRDRWQVEAAMSEDEEAIPPARLAYVLGELLEDAPWRLAHGSLRGWERRLWRFDRDRQHLGWHGGGGLGYGLGASIGAALASTDEVVIDLQPDGDLLYTPSALWTLAHERLPVLIVMHNNRQYENSVGHAREMAEARGRDPAKRYVGAGLTDPDIDYAEMARAHGVWGTGPIKTVSELKVALATALAEVRQGQPALVDVWTTGS